MGQMDKDKVDDGADRSAQGLPSVVQSFRLVKEELAWSLTWLPPNEDGGDAENMGYQVFITHENPLDQNAAWCEPRSLGSVKASPFKLSISQLRTLPPGTPFHLHLRARNSSGLGKPIVLKERIPKPPERELQARPVPNDWATIDVMDLMKPIHKRTGVPPEEQFAALYEVLSRPDYVATIKILFRFFCLQGKERDRMSQDAFFALAKSLGVISKELTRSELSLIFVRANINRVDNDESNDRPDSLLELAEFCSALTRMAAEKLPSLEAEGGLAVQMSQFLELYCIPQLLDFTDDPLPDVIARRDVQMVLYRHRARIAFIFGAFAIENHGAGAAKGCKNSFERADAVTAAAAEWAVSRTGVLGTMSLTFEAWITMMQDGNMFDKEFTKREATEIFVRVNLVDELFAPEAPSDDEKTTSIDEFESMLARLAREKVPGQVSFAAMLESFISLKFVPAYRRLLKKRGYAVPVTDNINIELELPSPEPLEALSPMSTTSPREGSPVGEEGDVGLDERLGQERVADDEVEFAKARAMQGRRAGRGRRQSVQMTREDIDRQLMPALSKIEIFKQMPPEELERVRSAMEEVKFHEGEFVFEQGDEGDAFYVLVFGSAVVLRGSEEQAEDTVLAELKEGDFFGERALIKQELRYASVKATSRLKAMKLTRIMFDRLGLYEWVPNLYKHQGAAT